MRFLEGIGFESYLKKSTFIFPIVIKLKINIDNTVHKNKNCAQISDVVLLFEGLGIKS